MKINQWIFPLYLKGKMHAFPRFPPFPVVMHLVISAIQYIELSKALTLIYEKYIALRNMKYFKLTESF